MRNLKKFLALVLAMIMVASAAAIVSADDATDATFTDVTAENPYAEAIADLVQKEITQGIGNGEFGADDGVKRYQMALFIARAATGETEWADQIVPFTDVPEYTGAIYYAYANGIVNGYNATTFGYNDAITYIQALKMAVATLGYEVEWTGDWKFPYYTKAVELGLTDGMVMGTDVAAFDKALTRAETAQIIYNMIYAAPAEGDLTLADKNFGTIEGIGVESTFVITATPKQAYVKDATTDENKYIADGNAIKETHVGIQALENGVPAGAIIYLPAADLGIAADADVEDYFNREVTLVNYDAETGAFDKAIIGEAPVVVNFKDITLGKNGASITVAGTTYKLVSNLTGSYLNKEIVVFDSTINAANTTGKNLLKDAAGNIVDENGWILAKLQVTNAGKFYVYTNSNGQQVAISEKDALDKFGYDIIGTEFDYADYTTKNTIDYQVLSSKYIADEAFELHLYDDDKDGEYERAIYLPIYISSYYTYKSGSYTYDHVAEDIATNDDDCVDDDKTVKTSAVAYNAGDIELTAGTVFSFTYNELLAEVTVNSVIEPETKTLKNIKYNNNNNATTNNYTITFTDGSSYTMYVDNDSYYADTAIGGELLYREHGTVKAPYIDDIEAGKYLGKTNVIDLVETANVGDDYTFYAVNGTIFFIEAVVDPADPYEYVVFDSIVDIDLNALYANVWYDGAYKAGATINQVGKKAIEKLNAYQLSLLIADEAWQKHGGVWATQYADGEFAMIEEILKTTSVADLKDLGLRMLDDKTYGETNGVASKLTFDGGATVYNAEDPAAVLAPVNRLYTNSKTVFYFIDTTTAGNPVDGEIYVEAYKMMPGADAYIEFVDNAREGTVIYADALGSYNATTNNTLYGAAKTVIVFDAVSHNGFEKLNTEYRWLTTAGMSAADLVTAGMTYAEDLGLKGYEEGLKVYAYTGAHDLEDASEAIIYSTFKLDTDTVYKTDKNGVVGVNAKGEAIEKANATFGTFYNLFKADEGIQMVNTNLRDFFAHLDTEDELVWVELGEYSEALPHTFLIAGTVTSFDIPVTTIIAIDADTGDVYEGEDAIVELNAAAEVYWVGERTLVAGVYEYDAASFKDGVAVFAFND